MVRSDRSELDGAVAVLSQAIDKQPDCAAYWVHRAAARGILGQFAEALQDVQQALQLAAPDTPFPCASADRSACKQDTWTRPSVTSKRACGPILRVGPRCGLAWRMQFGAAVSRTATGRLRSVASQDVSTERATSHALWGEICLLSGNVDEAVEQLLMANHLGRHDQFAKRKLYEAVLALDDPTRAEEVLGGLAEKGYGPANWWYLAELQRKNGNVEAYRNTCQGLLKSPLVPLLAGCVALTSPKRPTSRTIHPVHSSSSTGPMPNCPACRCRLLAVAVRYRLGDFAGALPYLESLLQKTEHWHNSFDQFYGTEAAYFLAMAQHRAGMSAESRISMQRAHDRRNRLNAAADKPQADMVWKLEHLAAEAQCVLENAPTAADPVE